MKKITIIITCFCAGLITSCGTQSTTTEMSMVHDTLLMPTDDKPQTEYDTLKMGRMMQGESVIASFALKNQSDKPLVIVSTVTGCGCTSVKYDPKPIQPEQSVVMSVTFDSKDQYGTQLKSIEIIAADHQVARIFLQCEVVD